MTNKNFVNKICSFCVSDWHLVTMLIPYISKKIDNEKFCLFLEDDMRNITNEFFSKLVLQEKLKKKIQNLNWEKTTCKYDVIKEKINKIRCEKNINIIVFGKQKYINQINKLIDKFLGNIDEDLFNFKNITIIDAYEVMQFNENLNEILDLHDKILNTSGEKEIEEVFEGYERKIKKLI